MIERMKMTFNQNNSLATPSQNHSSQIINPDLIKIAEDSLNEQDFINNLFTACKAASPQPSPVLQPPNFEIEPDTSITSQTITSETSTDIPETVTDILNIAQEIEFSDASSDLTNTPSPTEIWPILISRRDPARRAFVDPKDNKPIPCHVAIEYKTNTKNIVAKMIIEKNDKPTDNLMIHYDAQGETHATYVFIHDIDEVNTWPNLLEIKLKEQNEEQITQIKFKPVNSAKEKLLQKFGHYIQETFNNIKGNNKDFRV